MDGRCLVNELWKLHQLTVGEVQLELSSHPIHTRFCFQPIQVIFCCTCQLDKIVAHLRNKLYQLSRSNLRTLIQQLLTPLQEYQPVHVAASANSFVCLLQDVFSVLERQRSPLTL